MSFVEPILLGIIQGLTEFLPVSSSGHLALVANIFKTAKQSLLFEVGVHFGTVLSILFVYRKLIKKWLKELLKSLKLAQKNDGLRLFLLITVSAMPAGILGLLLKSYIESAFSNLLVVGVCFLITGVLLYWTEKKVDNNQEEEFSDFDNLASTQEISYKQALIVGWAQAFAILPGISRSGSTIAVALSLGVSRKAAAMFSFLMSIPVIVGATLLQLLQVDYLSVDESKSLVLAILVSFVFGLIGLYSILHFVKKAKLSRFSWYLWVLGVLSISYHFLGG